VDGAEPGAHGVSKLHRGVENDRIQPALTQRPQGRIPGLRNVIAGCDRGVKAARLCSVEPRQDCE
jgi:hypothetical protein